MPKNLTIKGEVEETLMEAESTCDNFVTKDIDPIINNLDKSEEMDHANDYTRRLVISDLLSALKALACGNYKEVETFIHAALQRINQQEIEDLKDDKPRTDARIGLAVLREKFVNASKRFTKLIERCGKAKK